MADVKISVKFPRAKVASQIVDEIQKILKSPQLGNQIGTVMTDRLKFQAKRGRPLNDTGSFKPLAPATIDSRKRLERYNKTSPVYSPGRSNVSFTGQLLDSMKFKMLQSKSFLLEIFFDGRRIPYKTGKDTRAKLTPGYSSTNEGLAKTLKDIGFVVFTKNGIESNKQLIDRVRNTLRSYLRKNLR
jgi:hypothetical protein